MRSCLNTMSELLGSGTAAVMSMQWPPYHWQNHFYQDCNNPGALRLAMALLQYCAKPSVCQPLWLYPRELYYLVPRWKATVDHLGLRMIL